MKIDSTILESKMFCEKFDKNSLVCDMNENRLVVIDFKRRVKKKLRRK